MNYLDTFPSSDDLQKQEILFHLTEGEQSGAAINLLASENQNALVVGNVMTDFLLKDDDKKVNKSLEWFYTALLNEGTKLSIEQCLRLVNRIHEEIYYILIQRHAYALALALIERAKKFLNSLSPDHF